MQAFSPLLHQETPQGCTFLQARARIQMICGLVDEEQARLEQKTKLFSSPFSSLVQPREGDGEGVFVF